MAVVRTLLGFGAAAMLLAGACASPEPAGATGAQCYRIEDCQEALVCVKNTCTGLRRDGTPSDLLKGIVGMSPLGPVPVDAGPPVVLGAGGAPGVGGGASGGGAKAAGGAAAAAGGTPGKGGAPASGGSKGSGGSLGAGGAPAAGGASSTPDGG